MKIEVYNLDRGQIKHVRVWMYRWLTISALICAGLAGFMLWLSQAVFIDFSVPSGFAGTFAILFAIIVFVLLVSHIPLALDCDPEEWYDCSIQEKVNNRRGWFRPYGEYGRGGYPYESSLRKGYAAVSRYVESQKMARDNPDSSVLANLAASQASLLNSFRGIHADNLRLTTGDAADNSLLSDDRYTSSSDMTKIINSMDANAKTMTNIVNGIQKDKVLATARGYDRDISDVLESASVERQLAGEYLMALES